MKSSIYVLAFVAAAALLTVMTIAFPPARMLINRLAGPTALVGLTVLAAIGAGAAAQWSAARPRAADGGRGRPPLHIELLVGYPITGTLLFLVGCVSTKPVPMLVSILLLAAAGLFVILRRSSDAPSRAEPLTAFTAVCVMLLGAA